MKRVTGVGGIFFKCEDPGAMYAWYEKHLGLKHDPATHGVMFHWRDADGDQKPAKTVWSLFPKDTKYFDPGRSSFMLNYRVDDLEALAGALRSEGVEVTGPESYDFGRFAWITDPEGNRIELWEPPKEA